jgi:hypothetical protein
MENDEDSPYGVHFEAESLTTENDSPIAIKHYEDFRAEDYPPRTPKKYPIALIERLIAYIENSLDQKLLSLERLTAKNKRRLDIIKEKHKKIETVVKSY